MVSRGKGLELDCLSRIGNRWEWRIFCTYLSGVCLDGGRQVVDNGEGGDGLGLLDGGDIRGGKGEDVGEGDDEG